MVITIYKVTISDVGTMKYSHVNILCKNCVKASGLIWTITFPAI